MFLHFLSRLRADIGQIEAVALSHWHHDHSGEIPKAIEMTNAQRQADGRKLSPIEVDLHPDRPDFRASHIPGMQVISLEADPTFEKIKEVDGTVKLKDQPHTLMENMFLLSGEILRVSEYEIGFKYVVRFDAKKGKWEKDEKIADERILTCYLRKKGLAVFTGCGHAGVINSAKHAMKLSPGAPLFAVVGGFHLADAEQHIIEQTVQDLKELDVKVVLAGHCTGWRAKFKFHKEMPRCFTPSFVAAHFTF